MAKIELSMEELENMKMALVHSESGWNKQGEALPWMTVLLKEVDFALGEPGVRDPEYGYSRITMLKQ